MAVFAAQPELYAKAEASAESPQFTGRVIDALARDAQLMDKSGQVLVGAELARLYGVVDIDGCQPPSYRRMLGDPTTFNPAVVE